jgi:hypothetical protein
VLLVSALSGGCSTISENNARSLGTSGKTAASAALSSIFSTKLEYERAMEAEVFYHSSTGIEKPDSLVIDWKKFSKELDARKTVFSRLSDVYSAFSDLASSPGPIDIKTALDELESALNNYSDIVMVTEKSLVPYPAIKIGEEIAALLSKHRKQRLIMESSVIIRKQLERLLVLLNNIEEQHEKTTFREKLIGNRLRMSDALWKSGVLDPSPMISDLAGDAGFQAGHNSKSIVLMNPSLKKGLKGVMDYRIRKKNTILIKSGYDNTQDALRTLIEEHKKLEKGESVSMDDLRRIINELQTISRLLSDNDL